MSDNHNDLTTTTTIGIAVSVFLVAASTTFILWHHRRSPSRHGGHQKKSWKEELEASSKQEASDVWSERRNKGVMPPTGSSSLHHRRTGSSEGDKQQKQQANKKPFGSTYYYAHNNPNAKGGYTDGLRMEDFTMNEPRLLSRKTSGGGADSIQATVEPSSTGSSSDQGGRPDSSQVPQSTESQQQQGRITAPKTKRTLPISKYLWDDPGNSNGVATIRIDQLPSNTRGTELVDWNEAGVMDVTANVNEDEESLTVLVKTTDDDNKDNNVDYRLHIPKLYGRVSSVTTIIKSKRLLVRLQKKKTTGSWLGNNNSNTKAWPHPQKKLSSSSY